jgi:hypothetical protein
MKECKCILNKPVNQVNLPPYPVSTSEENKIFWKGFLEIMIKRSENQKT